MNDCPATEQLQQFLAEQLSPATASALEQHVLTCLSCQTLLDQLTQPAFLTPPSAAETELPNARFRHRLKLLWNSPELNERAQLDIPFPNPPTEHGPLGQLLHYHLIEPLGWGTASVVFKAYDDKLDRLVAIKILRPERAQTPESHASFVKEARAAASVQHEHLVAIYQVESIATFPSPFLVMEYVEGETLRERVARLGPLPPREAARIVRETALGLAVAHAHGIIHRDIKPANILLASGTGHVKVTDFGLARGVHSGGLAGGSALAGTPTYMSPEQISTAEATDPRSDLYSLGVVLYELLTGEPPFRGPPARVMQQILHGQPLSPRLLDPTVPPELEALVMACLARSPCWRPRTAAELALALENWLNGQASRLFVHSWPLRLAAWGSRHPALTFTLSAAFVGLLGLSLWVFHLHHQQVEQCARLQEQGQALQRLHSTQALDEGVRLCEQGHLDEGLGWLVAALAQAPDAESQARARLQLGAWSPHQPTLRAVHVQEGAVYSVAFHPDGQCFVTAGQGQLVRQFDGRGEVRVSLPHQAPVGNVGFTPDGYTLLTRREGNVQCWDRQPRLFGRAHYHCRTDTAEGLRFQERYQSYHAVSAFSRDGRALLTVSKNQVGNLWDPRTNERIAGPWPMPWPLVAVALSPDGCTLATASTDDRVRLWEVSTGAALGAPCVHQESVTSVNFSPDSKLLLTSSKDYTARLWDARTGTPYGQPLHHIDKVYEAAFSPDGKRILTASKDHTVRVWETATGRPVCGPCVHPGPVFSAMFRPDGTALLTGCDDGGVRLWELPATAPRTTTTPLQREVLGLALTPHGHQVLLCSLEEQAPFCAITPHGTLKPPTWRSWARAAAFSPDGQTVVVATLKLAQLIEAATGHPRNITFPHEGEVRALAYSPDGHTIVTGGEGRQAHLWDATTGLPRGTTGAQRAAITALAVHPNNQLFATGSWDGCVRLWSLSTCQAQGQPLKHRGAVMALAFCAEGKYLATASRDGSAQLWDVATGAAVGPLMRHAHALMSVVIDPRRQWLATGSEDGMIRFWELGSGRPLGPPQWYAGELQGLGVDPSGRWLLAVGKSPHVQFLPLPQPLCGDVATVAQRIAHQTGRTPPPG